MATQPKKTQPPLPAHDVDVPLLLPALEPISLSPVTTLREAPSPAERAERSDAAANRKLILQVADALFAKHGVPNVHMAEIAKAAGVGQGTLYRRFANKSLLCIALLDTQMIDFQNQTITQLGQMMRAGQPKLQQLEWFLDALVHFNENHFPLLCTAMRDTPISPGAVSQPWVWQHMTVRGLLHGAIRAGEIPADVAHALDLPILTHILLAPMHPESFRAMRDLADGDLGRMSAGLQHWVSLLRR